VPAERPRGDSRAGARRPSARPPSARRPGTTTSTVPASKKPAAAGTPRVNKPVAQQGRAAAPAGSAVASERSRLVENGNEDVAGKSPALWRARAEKLRARGTS
jgi:hypothetical protein